MQKPGFNINWRLIALFILTAGIVITLDQVTKNFIRNYTGDWPIVKIGIFQIIDVHNTGSSFGMFQNQNLALTIVAFTGIVIILACAGLVTFKYRTIDTWISKLSLGLILGGTAGNLIDRLVHGYVTDFIDVGPWPTFNVADSSMVVGVIVLALFILFSNKVKELFSE